jgi:hypothetical protein
VVDVEAPGVVVVVAPPVGAVVLVVVAPLVVVVVEPGVVVLVDVVEVVGVGVVLVGGEGLTRLFKVVPVSAPPKMADSGLPEISSMAVMKSSASTNTVTALTAIARQENPRRRAGRATVVRLGLVEATRRSVAGASAVAEISKRWVSAIGAADEAISTVSASLSWPEPVFPGSTSDAPGLVCPTTSVGADDASTDDAAGPLTPVPPSLRNSVDESGTRTATCLTASWPRSIDCATKAVPIVAAADPMATPMIVPLTPKVDATTAAMTAPAVEARIWRNENFTPGLSSRPRGARQRG